MKTTAQVAKALRSKIKLPVGATVHVSRISESAYVSLKYVQVLAPTGRTWKSSGTQMIAQGYRAESEIDAALDLLAIKVDKGTLAAHKK